MPGAVPRDPIYRRRRYSPEIIELCVRWYLTYRLSYRDLAAMMAERGVAVSHTTILRWGLRRPSSIFRGAERGISLHRNGVDAGDIMVQVNPGSFSRQ